MTFKDFLITIKDKYPNAKNELILSAVNDLEEKLTTEILLPAGLGGQKAPLDLLNTDTELLLKNEDAFIYEAYVTSIIALDEKDFTSFNAYSALFNERFDALAVKFRKENMPKKSTQITGGMFI